MEKELTKIRDDTFSAIREAGDAEELEQIRIRVLGRKGELTRILRSLGTLTPGERGKLGQKSNEIKNAIETALEDRKREINESKYESILQEEWIDVTLDRTGAFMGKTLGRVHPISQLQMELEDIFTSMGFQVLDGPEVETEYYNFEALNIPKHHPARDIQDTFWTEDGNLLRTHTSSIQIRGMEKMVPPFRIIGPGRVFRYEATDASHENTFYQVEGMMVDRNISVSHLIYIMKVLLREIFKKEITVRLRPAYYPFVEPGFDLDFNCLICGGNGCAVCKKTGWIEFLGCGLVHPNVLRMGNIDPDEWSGFAFGLGLSRLAMMRWEINDIRHFLSGDIRFLEQF